jgi:hypothetical protein
MVKRFYLIHRLIRGRILPRLWSLWSVFEWYGIKAGTYRIKDGRGGSGLWYAKKIFTLEQLANVKP